MKKLILKLLFGGLLLGLTVIASSSFAGFTGAEKINFTDLAEGDDYYKEVRYLADLGIIQGYPDGSFRADEPVNRAEVLKIVFLALKPEYFDMSSGTPEEMAAGTAQVTLISSGAATGNGVIDFPDVPKEEWFFAYVKQARIDGMVVGCEDGNYYPARTVNLAELLKIMFRNDNRNIETYVREGPYN
ncbi:S-layer homology domain-containing protein, partial [Patescibacteria group bacterium]|nr:S-layer homology domain-containing protein [Patescibacteria group bacterium]